MTGKYPFPDDIRDPNRKEPNPFADSEAVDASATETQTFAASKHSNEYQPVYQAALPDRAVMTMVTGIFGVVVSLSGWSTYIGGNLYGSFLLMPLFSLAGSLPATLFSIADLRAMNKGAMKDHRRRWSRLALCLGAIGLLSSLIYLGVACLLYWDWL